MLGFKRTHKILRMNHDHVDLVGQLESHRSLPFVHRNPRLGWKTVKRNLDKDDRNYDDSPT